VVYTEKIMLNFAHCFKQCMVYRTEQRWRHPKKTWLNCISDVMKSSGLFWMLNLGMVSES